MKIVTKKKLKHFEEILRLQKLNICNEYMIGVYNGMLLVYSQIMKIDFKPLDRNGYEFKEKKNFPEEIK